MVREITGGLVAFGEEKRELNHLGGSPSRRRREGRQVGGERERGSGGEEMQH